jgi:hypothetical protein
MQIVGRVEAATSKKHDPSEYGTFGIKSFNPEFIIANPLIFLACTNYFFGNIRTEFI